MAKTRGKGKAPSKPAKKAAAAAASANTKSFPCRRQRRDSIRPWDTRPVAEQGKDALDGAEWDEVNRRAASFRWGELTADMVDYGDVAEGGGRSAGTLGARLTTLEFLKLREMNGRILRGLVKAGI